MKQQGARVRTIVRALGLAIALALPGPRWRPIQPPGQRLMSPPRQA